MSLAYPVLSQAVTAAVIGVGISDSRSAAIEQALSDLSQQLFVKVESQTDVYRDDQGTDEFSVATRLSSQLPLLGVRNVCSRRDGEYHCKSVLDPNSSDEAYLSELSAVGQSIARAEADLPKLTGSDRISLIQQLLRDKVRLSQLSIVASQLGIETSIERAGAFSQAELVAELSRLRAGAKTIRSAVSLVIADFNIGSADVTPPFLKDSREVTPFAKAIQDELEFQLSRGGRDGRGDLQLVGEYTIVDSGIDLTYSLYDASSHALLATSVVRMLPESYGDYEISPRLLDFDRLLHSGYAVSQDFSALVASNKGTRDLLFEDGETVELLVKLNKPGYFYIVGHSSNDSTQFSYLLDLQDAMGDRKFIRYVNADDANKWISLGEFAVEPPFGVESIQVLASEDDPRGALPNYKFDAGVGYYRVADSIEQGVKKVRATRSLKRVKKETAEHAESVMMFTTTKQ